MATSLYPFQVAQLGIEATKGTGVPATRQIIGDHNLVEERELYHTPYPAGVRANQGGAGTTIRQGTILDITTELNAEEILWPFETGVKGGITPSTVDTSAKLWVYTPEITTGVPTIKTATIEMARGDGVTNHYYSEAYHAMTRGFKIDWAFNQIAKMTINMFARARQTGTITAALTSYATRQMLASNLLSVYFDTTYGGLGGTQLTGLIRSASYEYVTGFEPDYVLDGRADADFGQFKVNRVMSKLSVVMEFDATAATQFAKFRTNSLIYCRLKSEGSIIGAVSAKEMVQIDDCYRFTGQPTFSNDGDQTLCTFSLESVNVAAEPAVFSAQNLLAAIT